MHDEVKEAIKGFVGGVITGFLFFALLLFAFGLGQIISNIFVY